MIEVRNTRDSRVVGHVTGSVCRGGRLRTEAILERILDPYIRREAEVNFPDFVGTAQLDHRFTGDSAFTLAEIDEEKWLVVGFDIGGGEHGHDLHMVAVDLEAVPACEGSVIDRLLAEHAHIPTRDVLLHDVDPYDFLKSMSHGFELRLRTRNAVGKTIMVTKQPRRPRGGANNYARQPRWCCIAFTRQSWIALPNRRGDW